MTSLKLHCHSQDVVVNELPLVHLLPADLLGKDSLLRRMRDGPPEALGVLFGAHLEGHADVLTLFRRVDDPERHLLGKRPRREIVFVSGAQGEEEADAFYFALLRLELAGQVERVAVQRTGLIEGLDEPGLLAVVRAGNRRAYCQVTQRFLRQGVHGAWLRFGLVDDASRRVSLPRNDGVVGVSYE